MYQPTLNHTYCPGAAHARALLDDGHAVHRMAWWEWNQTGNPAHPHVIVCVHGLTRQGRDFDALARHLSHQARVICPDVVGRGHSDWLADPTSYGIPQYVQDMLALLHALHRDTPIGALDWVGTSMGGLIGMALASLPVSPLCAASTASAATAPVPSGPPVPVRRMVINDIGPQIEWTGWQRIAQHVGQDSGRCFESVQQAAQALRITGSGFGPVTDAQWLELSAHMLRPQTAETPDASAAATLSADSTARGIRWCLHYDPRIAQPFCAVTQDGLAETARTMWQAYDRISARTLLLRGELSDILPEATAHAMTERGPRAQRLDIAAVGHAPMLVDDAQITSLHHFLLDDDHVPHHTT